MLLIFFSLLSLCFPAQWFVSPWGTCFTWLYPRRVAFHFNQEPSWLPIFRHLAFPWFVSFRQITHESKIPSWLKDSDIIHKILEQATPFFPLFHPWNSNVKNTSHHTPSTTPWAGEFFDRIAFFAVYPQQSVTQLGWTTVLISRQPMIRSKLKPKKNIIYSTKTQYSKKFLESI